MNESRNEKLALIGTCFTDIKGFAVGSYDPVGRNLGSIAYIHGGVARNLAVNCARMGQKVEFISMADRGSQGDRMLQELQAEGVSVVYVLRTEENGTGLWLAILDEKGDLAGSISQPPDLSLLERHLRSVCRQALYGCSGVMLDIDLNESIARITLDEADRAQIPVYGVVGNLSVVLKHPDILSKTDCFICNEIEAGKIFDRNLKEISPESILAILKTEAELRQIPCMVITLGSKGAVYCDRKNGICGIQEALPAKVKDTTGAGDAFFSACICAIQRGYSIDKAVGFGAALSAKVIETNENVCPNPAEYFLSD